MQIECIVMAHSVKLQNLLLKIQSYANSRPKFTETEIKHMSTKNEIFDHFDAYWNEPPPECIYLTRSHHCIEGCASEKLINDAICPFFATNNFSACSCFEAYDDSEFFPDDESD